MRITHANPPLNLTKLCHATPGDVVHLFDSNLVEDPAYYLVTAFNEPKKRPAPKHSGSGLYTDERDIWLVDLETGLAKPMPHLSSRCKIVRNASVVIDNTGGED